jgi:O-antigen ligase
MSGMSIASRFYRARLATIADGLVVAVAVALPWSTTATGILLVLWLIALIPTLEWADIRRELATPAGGLPVLLFLLGALGMAWADVSLLDRWKGLDGFVKLLAIPLLMIQFRLSNKGERVFIGFLIACVALLIGSWITALWPHFLRSSQGAGVAVKNYIVQSAEFLICAAALLHFSTEATSERRWRLALASIGLAFLFLTDIFFIATSRTSLVVIAGLILLYGAWQFRWIGIFVAILGVAIISATVWTASPYLRDRVNGIWQELSRYESANVPTPSGERIVFWSKSIRFIESAPLIGHGTGSITEMFRQAAASQTGVRAEVASNPHDQTFAVAIQLGLIGAAVLWAMWLSHISLFRGGSQVAWIGLVVVAQNIIGSLFNSFLFDFTEGWLYVVGFGVTAGMMLRESDSARIGKGGAVKVSAS